MKRLYSVTENETPLEHFRSSVNNVISSLAVIKQLKSVTNDTTKLVALDIIRHGVRSDENIELPVNTHIINISITPVNCVMLTSYSGVLQNDIPAFFFGQLTNKLDEITSSMDLTDSEEGFEQFKGIISEIVSNELKIAVSQHIPKLGRVNIKERKIRISKASPEELCEITIDTEINNKIYSVKTLPEDQHSMLEFNKSSRSSRRNTSMDDIITMQQIINDYRMTSSKEHLWIILLDSTCNAMKLGGKHFKKTRKNRKSKYKNKRKIRRKTKRVYCTR